MHRTRTFLADIRNKDPEWLRENVPFRFEPITEEELENKSNEEKARITIPRLNTLNPLPLVGFFADQFHPEINPYELDYTYLTKWLQYIPGPPPAGYVYPIKELEDLRWGYSGRCRDYMMKDLWRLPEDDKRVIDRLGELPKLVSDVDGYKLGTWFTPPGSDDSKRKQLALASREDISETYEWASSLWEDDPQHKALKESFEALSTALGSTKVNKLVCIGLGSLSPPPFHTLEELREGKREAQKNGMTIFYGHWYLRPYFKHLAAQTMAQVLKGQNDGKPLDLYAQDIGYREDDIKVLENDIGNLGNNHGRGNFTVLDGSPNAHEGFLMIDSETYVFAVQPAMPLRQMVCEVSTPAAILCVEIKTKGEKPDDDVPSSKVMEAKENEKPRPSDGLHLLGPHLYLSLPHCNLTLREADFSNDI
ncbi:hypothetical protein PG996_014302 [Apiospora saccharicola]|uniref:SRR1-like domain-containing protein n=1 Tax=Apiospora saccharicola TaxID=335842 RepID=A0ABR1THY0_9PEZI